ncbi:SIMPL domain-containing protein [Candidatus Woesearchaeota archaeon]|nr:SIMPL domain-containing protein [Candidatus Woesearchaeota archaeon]
MEKNNLPWIVAIAAIVLLAFVFWQNQGTIEQNTISVSGLGEMKVSPDKADIWVLVESSGADASAAQDTLSKNSEKVLAAIRAQGIADADIQSTGFNVYPDYQWNPETGENRIKGYKGQHSIQVTVKDLTKTGAVVDAIGGQNGLVQNVQFGLTDAKRKAYDNQVRILAVADARQKAESLTATAGARLGKVLSIQESDYYPPWPVYGRDVMMAESGSIAKAVEVLPSDVNVQKTVNVVYELK